MSRRAARFCKLVVAELWFKNILVHYIVDKTNRNRLTAYDFSEMSLLRELHTHAFFRYY